MSMTNVNISMDNDIKRQAQALFSEFGMDATWGLVGRNP